MMKVELNIESDQLGETVVDLFKNLKEEEKKELSKQVIINWFNESNKAEYNTFRLKTISDFKAGKHTSSYGRNEYNNMSDEDFDKSYTFNEEMKRFKDSKGELVNLIKHDLLVFGRNYIKEIVLESEEIKDLQREITEEIKNDMPRIMKEAVMYSATKFFMNNAWSTQQDMEIYMNSKLN